MEHVRWLSEPELRAPTLVCAFTGWNDAGDAASSAVRTLVERWGATAVAEIDPEAFTDFATVRPHVRLDHGRRTIVWPTVGVWSASTPGGDVLLALGPEPALRWKLFCAQFVGIASRFEVPMTVSLGALLADVPHSRPVHVIGTASDTDVIDRFDLQPSRYEGPTGIVGVLSDTLGRAGVALGVPVGRGPRLRPADPVAQGRAGTRRAGLRAARDTGADRGAAPRRRRLRRAHRRADRRGRRPPGVRQPPRVDGRRGGHRRVPRRRRRR